MTLSKRQLKKLNQQESVQVRYIGKKWKSWWGDGVYEAVPGATIHGGHVNARWEITDRDGDVFIVADRALMNGLEKDWEVVPNA